MERSDRVGEEVRDVVASLLRDSVKDPRLPAMVSVVDVEMSRDLSHAKIFISVMGDDAAKKDAAAALKSAAGFLRREVASRIRLRIAPELRFVIDDSIERGFRLAKLIDEVNKGQRPAKDE
jgi:ribosome-binding factor A